MDALASHLASHTFKALFIEFLGWDHASAATDIEVDGHRFHFDVIAQKRGFQVLRTEADKYTLFNRRRLRSLQKELLKVAHEHIVIYSCEAPRKQVWQWAVRLPDGRRLRHREHPFFSLSPPEALLGRLHCLRFSLDEEERVTLVDALDRVRAALDTEADVNLFVNKPWYAEQSDRLAIAMGNGDAAAFHRFVEFHLPYARWGAKRWRRYCHGLDEEEREQIAAIGLLEAARRFEPSRGYQFATYAYHWLRQACQRYGPECAHLIRIPRHVLSHCASIRARLHRLSERGATDAMASLLQDLWERSPKVAEYWCRYRIATSVQSLSDPREPEYAAARRLLDSIDGPATALHRLDVAVTIDGAIDTLPPDDSRMIRLRYGFDEEPQTLEQIGKTFGLTKERIRQRLEKAEDQLRPILAKSLGIPLPPAPVSDSDATDDAAEDESGNGYVALTAVQRMLVGEIARHPDGLGAVDLACRCALGRATRKAALRSLVQEGRIEQNGAGRKAVYRIATSTADDGHCSTQMGLFVNAD